MGGTVDDVAGSAVRKTLAGEEAVLDCSDGCHWSDGWILSRCLKEQAEKTEDVST